MIEEYMLPEGWAIINLGSIASKITKGTTPTTNGFQYQDSGVSFVKVENIEGGKIRHETIFQFISEEAHNAQKRSALAVGDVLYSIAGTIGKTCVVHEADVPANTNQALAIIKGTNSVLHASYLRNVLESNLTSSTKEQARGGAMNNISLADLKATLVPIPPINEQHRIVNKLERAQHRIKNTFESLELVRQLLQDYCRSVLASAFRGDLTKQWREANPDVEPASVLLERIRVERRKRWEEAELAKLRAKGKEPKNDKWKAKYKEPAPVDTSGLPELPAGWMWTVAEEIVEPGAEIVYGIVQPGKKLEKGIPYVRGKDIVDGQILVDQLLRTSPEIAKKYERASLRGGDILLGIIRATKVAVIPDVLNGANITQGTARFRPSEIIRTPFLAGWLDSPFAQNWLHSHYRGIDMPGLNLRDVRRLPVPICSLQEQDQISNLIKAAESRRKFAQKSVVGSLVELEKLSQSTLNKAFCGELVSTEADLAAREGRDYEPASVLLERIQEERRLLDTKKRKVKK